jgi:L-amino acid N-acyltransferase YncA
MNTFIRATPWDTVPLSMPTWELLAYSEAALQQSLQTPGHHTIKVSPLDNKKLLHDYGYYYCDTLIEPYCTAEKLRAVQSEQATVSKVCDAGHVLEIGHGVFAHGRFQRDFNLPAAAARLRYDTWLKQLLGEDNVYGLYSNGELAGFIGHVKNNLVLHAVAKKFRGKGLAKYWWSAVCVELLGTPYSEMQSSISAANLAVLNLYAGLGFSFRNPQDVYHRIVT